MAEEIQAKRTMSTSPQSRITFKVGEEFIHKPIIRDALRTDSCISGSIMLVEKVEIIEASVSNPSAMRLLLGDGELCIQAFLNPQVHGLVEAGEITMGCYVRLDEFSIERIDIDGGEDSVRLGKGDKPTKRKRQQQVVFLKIDRLDTVGWDFAYMKLARPTSDTNPPLGSGRSHYTPDFDAVDILENSETAYKSNKRARKTSLSGSIPAEDLALDTDSFGQSPHKNSTISQSLDVSKDTRDKPLEEFRRGEDDPPDQVVPESSEELSTNMRLIQNPDESPELLEPSKPLQETDILSRKPNHIPLEINPQIEPPKVVKEIPIPSRNPTSLVPRTLASLSKLPSRQNSPCTVFAIIDEISPVKPCPIPPHKTREVRLVDPSTNKRVLLSVLWQPETFTPEVGTPVLLRGLKNHRYDGGSLNAYPKSVSPFTQNADGSDWWIPFPRGWDGCDVDGYLEWWKQRQKQKN